MTCETHIFPYEKDANGGRTCQTCGLWRWIKRENEKLLRN